jgi:signal transduction histidine kinase
MIPGNSLRLRLIVASALAITLALTASSLLLSRLFAEHVERRTDAELNTHLNQIVASLEVAPDGTLQNTGEPADPRFQRPYSGLYWQIDQQSGPRQRSRSLWDFELTPSPATFPAGAIQHVSLLGPGNSTLFAIDRAVRIGPATGPLSLHITVGIDRHDIDIATSNFRTVLAQSLLAIGTALLLAFAAMLQIGLLPLKRLSSALQRMHVGERTNVDGTYPSEVQSLVDDVNRLLDKEHETVARARERASDLAHGFKTPLAVLSAVSRDLKREDRTAAAAEIDMQIDLMGRHVSRELARVRMSGASAVERGGIAVRPIADKVVAALRRIAEDRDLSFTVDGAASIRFAGDDTDLLELLGNLCENASKWARTSIRVGISRRGADVVLVVEDDGPGIDEGQRNEVLARGRRLDEGTDGSGLGLAIVTKTVEAYAGGIGLSRSTLGGLRVEVTLPAAANLTAT